MTKIYHEWGMKVECSDGQNIYTHCKIYNIIFDELRN